MTALPHNDRELQEIRVRAVISPIGQVTVSFERIEGLEGYTPRFACVPCDELMTSHQTRWTCPACEYEMLLDEARLLLDHCTLRLSQAQVVLQQRAGALPQARLVWWKRWLAWLRR